MKTNYRKLSGFDSAAIVAIVMGIGLIGLLVFGSLSTGNQAHVIKALAMFDIHEQVIFEAQELKQLAGLPDRFMQEFYIAFTQVAAIDQEQVAEVQKIAAAAETSWQKISQLKMPQRGTVAGASITAVDPPPESPPQLVFLPIPQIYLK